MYPGGVGQHPEHLHDQQGVIVSQLLICIHTQIVADAWNKFTSRPVSAVVSEHTVVIYANPRGPASRANAALLRAVAARPGTEIRDLTVLYPAGTIDVVAEQEALEWADHVVLQYPTYWYSMPGAMKNWLDQVMTPGWAYGPGTPGVLAGKTLRIATTTGGATEGYRTGQLHGFEYAELLTPLRATARRLGMEFAEPFVLHGVRDLSDAELAEAGERYAELFAATPVRVG
nr:NAD(P)H-dependent oxidoreductase [Mycolicibacterium sphagni]